MFVSEVDHVKYPEVSQKYRFELVRIQNGEHIASPTTEKTATQTATQIAAQTAMTDVQTATLTEKTDAQTATFITEQTVAHTIPHIQPHILDRTQVQIQESGTNSSSIAYRRERKEDERIEQSTFDNTPEGSVNALLLKFLDAPTYSKKLEVISSNTKHLNDRLINDMAVAIDCMVEDGPLDQRIHELIYCLQAMCRFEDRRQR